ncbi:MAG: hypothetical protein KC550_01400 [Nanoarchaeota archaeon]|nr:hypothetical protein [Nanoarchaeota archaeon]
MSDYNLGFDTIGKKISKGFKRSGSIINLEFSFAGFNEDVTEMYHWHINFPYYVGKGYTPLKLEDYHYFSENSQFGQNMRQIKGGSIRAFQENLQQLVQLIKVHMMPLLKEIKQADFYKEWFDKIIINDGLIQKELKMSSPNAENLKKWRSERNEALNHLKDKWVNEVDGGKIWQMNRPATEQGLDFALLPQLFFGANLDNPLVGLHGNGKSLKEQLDEDIYSVDITLTAKEQVARFMYRFYTWLPSAVRETETTFKIKISALKQMYSQLQMYIGFMKPLLLEISRKSESLNSENFYKDFESENPEFVNLFDHSYSFVKILGVKGLQRLGYQIADLEFSRKGLFLRGSDLAFGPYKGKSGYAKKVNSDNMIEFYPCDSRDISEEDFSKLKMVLVNIEDLRKIPVMEFNFIQRRRNEIQQTQQGPQIVPFMKNKVEYRGYVWNIFEVATYRESLKEDNLDLLASFIEEVNVMKEDLLYYVEKLQMSDRRRQSLDANGGNDASSSSQNQNVSSSSASNSDSSSSSSLIFGPFLGIVELLSPIVGGNSGSKSKTSSSSHGSGSNSNRDKANLIIKFNIIEDTWKLYTINKKAHRIMQY